MNVKFHILIIASLLLFGCTKSEVTDTADGTTPIGFETYIGRDAQTKAASYGKDNLPASVGVYGFYSGAKTWTATDNPNLWANLLLTNNSGTWSYDQNQVRYWVNSQDNYTFLSYAPYATGATGNGLVASTGPNPTLTYTVPEALSNQIDLLYSNTNKNIHKPTTGTSVTLDHKHALSRLTVKASAETAEGAYTFHVKEISITGNFYTEGVFTLESGSWGSLKPASTTYTFYTNGEAADATNALGATVVDYGADSNYLMMIPVNFASNNAVLTVKYTALYGGVESGLKTANLPISTNFVGGSAYAINIKFELSNAIEFSCDLDVSSDEDGNNDGWNNIELGIQ